MDNTVLGLSVAVAVVIVLLLSCWDSKPKKRSAGASVQYSGRVAPGCAKAAYGSAVHDRRAKERYSELADLARYEDYGAVAQFMSVEPEVHESHERYSKDMGRSTSGPSSLSVTDHSNDLVPYVGMFRPKYRQVCTGPNARQDNSESPDQMRPSPTYCFS